MNDTITMAAEECASCRHWMRNYTPAAEGADPEPTDNGACRRNPPAVVMTHWAGMPSTIVGAPPTVSYQALNFGSMFPTMMESGWCGDWSPKPPMNA